MEKLNLVLLDDKKSYPKSYQDIIIYFRNSNDSKIHISSGHMKPNYTFWDYNEFFIQQPIKWSYVDL